MFTLFKFSILDLGQEANFLFGKNERISASIGEVLHFPHFQSANCERAALTHLHTDCELKKEKERKRHVAVSGASR